MSERAPVRAGILVTGTEVLTGIISDRNGPWLSERLREVGVDAAMIQIVGDRPEDLLAALEYMRREGMALVVTSGGLGPTADDLTAEIVGRFCGREMVLDDELEAQIAEILRPLMRRWPGLDPDAIRAVQPQAGGDPRGRDRPRPGRHRAGAGRAAGRAGGGPTVVVLPGPPRELQPMWRDGDRRPMRSATAIAGATTYAAGSCACSGSPSPRSRARCGRPRPPAWSSSRSRSRRACAAARSRCRPATSRRPRTRTRRSCEFIRERHSDTLFSEDGSTVDEQVIALLAGRTVAVAESCTGGLMSARLTDRGGSSAYFLGGVVAYSNEAKVEHVGVDAELIERYGAVSTRGRRGARRRRCRALRRRHRDRDHRHRGARRRHRGEARRHGVLLGQLARRAADHAQHAAAGRPRRRPRSLDDGRHAPAAEAA